MKKIMICVHPKHLVNILNLIKTLEIRSWIPKAELPLEVHIYCSKDPKQVLWIAYDKTGDEEPWEMSTDHYELINSVEHIIDAKGYHYNDYKGCDEDLCGKVVAKFILRKFDTYYVESHLLWKLKGKRIETSAEIRKAICKGSCLIEEELMKMARPINSNQNHLFVWQIDELEIFDESKTLADYGLTRAPQKMVWLKEN